MKIMPLTADERRVLSDYRVALERLGESDLSLAAASLFRPHELRPFLAKAQDVLKAPDLRTAASIFAKRYGYLLTVPAFYSFSVWNKSLQLHSDRLYLEPSDSEEHWLPRLGVPDTVTVPESAAERELLRDTLIQAVFADHLHPLWSLLSETASISKQVLWENTAIYLYWLYETLLHSDLPEDVMKRVREDLDYVLHADFRLFGTAQKQPLAKFYTDKRQVDDQLIRIRQTCCLTYMASGSYCKSCPKACHVLQS
ncbi:IucA/IucC family C-terminal-domain containing protein [Xylanibacillus composti]|uniref:Aerobactin siderophore biosynthesis IucA/IucC-like C-terminal domain-containing protein n=1 Tax=Xylanibacillus composti TaxID=1572762 RepID=A0A8J4M328_9BACL|nr:IucA/IucC family C-terminal-domain containing protein [Xylanibacillus composti]GIQ69141.1 hypothetical protein XYCOK13_19650 [Xylanibacillus composti]